MARSHLWEDLSRDEIAELRDQNALVVLPTGAVEQHASHLPVGTDLMTVTHLSRRAAEIASVPVVILPTIAATFSPHHMSWPGTLSLSLETFFGVVRDIARSVAHAGFKRQLVINGHGGNHGPLTSFTAELVGEGIEIGFADYWNIARDDIARTLKGQRKMVGHACEMETALIMAIHADRSATLRHIKERAAALPPILTHPGIRGDGGAVQQGAAWYPPVFGADHPGYEGDPAAASVETGERLVEAITGRLAAFYEEFRGLTVRSGQAPGL